MSEAQMFGNLTFNSIERFIFDVFVQASFCMALVRLGITEWRALKRLLGKQR